MSSKGKPRRPFLPEKADELGVPFGPERRDLVAGKEITLPDGKRIKPDDVLGPLQKGVKLVVVGDTGRTDDLLEVCRDADALVIESTYMDEEAEMAHQFSHLTARMAAELAIKAGVKKLILTHISRRYREKDVLKEAQAIFPNSICGAGFRCVPDQTGRSTSIKARGEFTRPCVYYLHMLGSFQLKYASLVMMNSGVISKLSNFGRRRSVL